MKKSNDEELQSRRQFFKNVAKGTLPILGAIALANLPLMANAAPSESGTTPTGCRGGCAEYCLSTCKGSCQTTCKDSCRTTCNQACYHSCSGSCQNTCSGSCKRSSH